MAGPSRNASSPGTRGKVMGTTEVTLCHRAQLREGEDHHGASGNWLAAAFWKRRIDPSDGAHLVQAIIQADPFA